MDVLWLTPDKPENISVGRRRIADGLEQSGHRVVLRGTTGRTIARSLSERGCYDVVVGTTRAGALAGMAVSRGLSVPLVVDHVDPIRQFRGTHPRWLSAPVGVAEALAFRLAAHVLYVYDEERERVAARTDRFTKTALGVDFDRFADPDPSVLEAGRERLRNYDPAENVAVYVGGLEPLYNVTCLLDAVQYLDEWSLLVLGTGSLSDQVRRRADGSTVIYPGTVPHEEVPGLLHASSVGLSLVDDAHTLKVLEYGAAGLPVVQLDGYARGRFGDRLTYCDPNSESVADAIRSASERDGGSLRSFVSRFDWAEIAATYDDVLTRVASSPSKP